MRHDGNGKRPVKVWGVVFLLLLIATAFGLVWADAPAAVVPGSETRLLPENYDVWSCDWAPNGKAMVFAGKLQGDDSIKMRIWHWSLDPMADPAALTKTDQLIDFSPRWSPDGSKIVMTRRSYNRNNNNIVASSIWIKEMPSGAGKQLTTGPEDRDPAWSPDGTQIVFVRGQGPYKSQLVILNVTDGSAKILKTPNDDLASSPWWGKDGKIYFARQAPALKSVTVSNQTYQVMDFGRGSIWAFNPAENTIEPVINDGFDNRQPVMSLDGSKLAFVSDRAMSKDGNGKFDRGSLYIRNMNTGEVVYATNRVGLNGGALSWSPDGKKLAFFTFRSIRPAIWVLAIP